MTNVRLLYWHLYDACALILGDNIFYSAGLLSLLKESVNLALNGKAIIYSYYVNDPERFGIVEFDDKWNVVSIEEKPKNPKSNYCITGLYFYPNGACKKAKDIKLSSRGEYEITKLNKMYLNDSNLHVITLGRGYSWIDAGTLEALVDASNYIKMIEDHQGLKVCCPEEIAYKNGLINKFELIKQGELMSNNQYGQHLLNVSNGKIIY